MPSYDIISKQSKIYKSEKGFISLKVDLIVSTLKVISGPNYFSKITLLGEKHTFDFLLQSKPVSYKRLEENLEL